MRVVVLAGSILLAMLACDAAPPTPSEAPPTTATKRDTDAPAPTKRDTAKPATTRADPAKPIVAAVEPSPTVVAKPTTDATEELGTLRIGMTLDELKAAVPAMKPDGPPLKGEDEWFLRHMADQQRFQAISTAPSEHGPWKLGMITVAGKSKRKTKAGIGIGATKAEVLRAYPTAKYDPYDAGREVALVELGPDEGLFFILEDGEGRVVSIELGDLRPCAQCE